MSGSAIVIQFSQAGAKIEGTISYARHAVRDHDGSQAAATTECHTSNARHAIRDSDGSQRGALNKQHISNACHSAADDDGGQTGACGKCPIPYACHTVRDHDGSQAAAKTKCPIPYACHTVRDHNGSQADATNECHVPNARHTVPNSDGGQTAITERRIPYACHAVADNDGGQRGILCERHISNARHTVRNHNGSQADATSECLTSNARHTAIVRDHTSRAPCNQRLASGFYDAIAGTVVNAVPFFHSDRSQPRDDKCPIPYTSHTRRNGDRGKIAAIIEGILCNATRSISQFNDRYAVIDAYRPTANITHAIHFLNQVSAAQESILSYARHAVRNGDGGDVSLISKRIRRDRGSSIRDDDLTLNFVSVQI